MAVCLARHGAREDYACKKRGVNWQLENDKRPWDPPLTAGGVQQGAALGVGLKAHCARLGLPPVTRVVCSPLLRCIQTAAAAAQQLGVPALSLEPGLAEGMLEEWYRSWGVPGADSTWGGPQSCPCGAPVDSDRLHPACHVPAGTLLLQPQEASAALVATQPALGEAVSIDWEYVALEPEASYRWPDFETEEGLAARIKRTLEVGRLSAPAPPLLPSLASPLIPPSSSSCATPGPTGLPLDAAAPIRVPLRFRWVGA